jgi:membrane-associated phospholipid phosphatase
MSKQATSPAISTVTTADDGWYRGMTAFAQYTGWLQPIMVAYTILGLVALGALVALGWWTARRAANRAALAAVLWTGIATCVSVALGLGLKQVFAETRPCLALAHVTTVQPCPGPTDYSFPSDHATVATALAAGIYLVNRRLGALAAILALLEGFSRVYLGQHYPHDVAAAIVLSTLVVFAGWPLARRPLTRLLERLEGTVMRPLLTATHD